MQDLNKLVDELNVSRTRAAEGQGAGARPLEPRGTGGNAGERLTGWLRMVREARGSDLLLVSGVAPAIRVNGEIRPLPQPPLDGAEIEDAILPGLPPHAARSYQTTFIADASLRVPELGRFRVNLHHERGRPAATLRALPSAPPALSSLGLPPEVEQLTRLPRGLVLVGGPTGSGKTTTLAAFVEEINRRDPRHIVIIEDPIEYEHAHRRSIVEQVEIGIDAPDFPTALRAVVRQAPDVIVVGEMRDPETMRIALSAAETGHLVLSTVHTTDAASAVARIADSFPPERQPTIRQEIAMALSAVLTQMLVPRRGGGRIPAVELLVLGFGARQHIRKNALQHLYQEITLTRRQGSITLEASLARSVRAGMVEAQDALARAAHTEELEALLRSPQP
jgi:twitching motility protein PilT